MLVVCERITNHIRYGLYHTVEMEMGDAQMCASQALGVSVNPCGSGKVRSHPAVVPYALYRGHGSLECHNDYAFPGYKPTVIIIHRIAQTSPLTVLEYACLILVKLAEIFRLIYPKSHYFAPLSFCIFLISRLSTKA